MIKHNKNKFQVHQAIQIHISEPNQETIALSFERSYDVLFKEHKAYSELRSKKMTSAIEKKAKVLIKEIQHAQTRIHFSDIYSEMLEEFIEGIEKNILLPLTVKNTASLFCQKSQRSQYKPMTTPSMGEIGHLLIVGPMTQDLNVAY